MGSASEKMASLVYGRESELAPPERTELETLCAQRYRLLVRSLHRGITEDTRVLSLEDLQEFFAHQLLTSSQAISIRLFFRSVQHPSSNRSVVLWFKVLLQCHECD